MDARMIAAMQERASTNLVEKSRIIADLINVPEHILLDIQTQRGTPFERQVMQIDAVCKLLDAVIEHLQPQEPATDGEDDG